MAKHHAEQIVDAIAAILEAAAIPAGAYRELSYEEGELPAISVRMGPDAPDEPENIPIIDSVLTVLLVCAASGPTEASVAGKLMALRTDSHKALMADRQLGLAFVSDTRYGGASQPQIEHDTTEKATGLMETTWLVPYRMNLADPST